MEKKPRHQFIELGIPGWLQPPKQTTSPVYTEWTIDHILDNLSRGIPVVRTCDEPNMPDYAAFLRHVHRNPELKERYYEAQAIATEVMASQVLSIADQNEPGKDNTIPEDVQRSKLRIDSRLFLMRVWNKPRYADTKTVDVNHNINLNEAMAEAQARIMNRNNYIEGEATVVNSDGAAD